jgi:hypothetical protein
MNKNKYDSVEQRCSSKKSRSVSRVILGSGCWNIRSPHGRDSRGNDIGFRISMH